MALRKLDRGETMVCLDTSGTGGLAPTWTPVGLTSVLRLDYGADAVVRDYPSRAAPVTYIAAYRPSVAQALALYEGDPAYDFVARHAFSLPLGGEAAVPALVLFGGEGMRAWRADGCVVVPGMLDAARGRITFLLELSGDIVCGRYAIEDGSPAFMET
ncbi:MAG: hypothetical protein E7317_05605 [Clostridiales bacterium]|nr:hypothetical protein [Clostridiales bacterium]